MNKTQLEIVLASEPPRSGSTPGAGQQQSTITSHSHIPLPKASPTSKVLDRYPPARNRDVHQDHINNRGNNGGNLRISPLGNRTTTTTSVALHRASFERGESNPGIQQFRSRNNSSNSNNEFNKNTQDEKTTLWRTNSNEGKRVESIRSSLELNNDKKILNRSNSFMESKWKTKYEDSEKRRKLLLQKNESTLKDHADLEKKYNQLQRQNNTLQTQVQDREEKLHKLRTVSEAVCKEYGQLKRQYDVETGAMHKAMQQATQWYKQNRELKRKSQVLAQKFLQVNPDGIIDIDISDEVDSNSDDAEQLRETVRELSEEVARLQTELNFAKLQEFEAQEQVTLLSAQLEEERTRKEEGEEKMRDFQKQRENMERVTRLVADEVQSLKEQCEKERETAQIMKIEADRAQKERNVLAHQSSLLLAEVATDPDGRLLAVLQEVESLKRSLEEEQQRHVALIQGLQEKLEERESIAEFEILEEKLKLADAELEIAIQRSECAERSVARLEKTVQELEEKVKDLEFKAAQPPAPPLPPPPPPPPMFGVANATIKLLTREKNRGDGSSAVTDMENMLGITKKPAAVAQQPAIDDVISQIKGGRFTLKQTDKQREEERRRRQEAEAAPPAVSEMLTILGTMRRRAKPTRQSFKFADFNESTA
ncbi:shootin-1 [Athalia rosae]|uniref:shootin-1 n=1 Tax=Athalia rosae TaxID=37344 RepID=UPI00203427D4|nr:shootin-1 [Athalia rosae]XP_020707888.2 shootin-1 [Athalia rosae]